jgi:hypothetical protein
MYLEGNGTLGVESHAKSQSSLVNAATRPRPETKEPRSRNHLHKLQSLPARPRQTPRSPLYFSYSPRAPLSFPRIPSPPSERAPTSIHIHSDSSLRCTKTPEPRAARHEAKPVPAPPVQKPEQVTIGMKRRGPDDFGPCEPIPAQTFTPKGASSMVSEGHIRVPAR